MPVIDKLRQRSDVLLDCSIARPLSRSFIIPDSGVIVDFFYYNNNSNYLFIYLFIYNNNSNYLNYSFSKKKLIYLLNRSASHSYLSGVDSDGVF